MKILYLYTEVMGYTMATIRALCNQNAEVHVLHWDNKKLTPYTNDHFAGAFFYPRAQYTKNRINLLIDKIKPSLAVVSGWMDKEYLSIAKILRKRGTPVVCGFDNQWYSTPKQYVAAMLSCFGFFRSYFSHAWVSGPYQYEYARHLGFEKKQIIYDLYSADIELFEGRYYENKDKNQEKYPHRFLYVGRLVHIKAVDLLFRAWKILGSQRKDWDLHLIGNGPFKKYLLDQSSITVHDFMKPDQLAEQIASAGCFILPSRSEPWGVVIHEFAAAGLPLICSDVCGAAQTFLIHGINGFKFVSENVNSLAEQMVRIIETEDQTLMQMGEYSNQLAQRITPKSSAANLMSIV